MQAHPTIRTGTFTISLVTNQILAPLLMAMTLRKCAETSFESIFAIKTFASWLFAKIAIFSTLALAICNDILGIFHIFLFKKRLIPGPSVGPKYIWNRSKIFWNDPNSFWQFQKVTLFQKYLQPKNIWTYPRYLWTYRRAYKIYLFQKLTVLKRKKKIIPFSHFSPKNPFLQGPQSPVDLSQIVPFKVPFTLHRQSESKK